MEANETGSRTGRAGDYRDFEPGSPLKSYLGVTHGALFDPGRFFVAVAGLTGWWRPVLFIAASYAWDSALFALLVTLLLAATVNGALFGDSAEAFGDLAYWPIFVGCLPAVMIGFGLFFALLTFIGALLWHPLVVLAVGRGAGFRATLRVVAYTSGIQALGLLVPFVGPLLATFGGILFGGLGIKAAHRTSTARAMLAVVLPYLLLYLGLGFAFALYLAYADPPPGGFVGD